MPPREFQLRVKGSALHVRELGSGPTVLFLHGAGGADSLVPCLAPLAANYRLLIPDHPGFGASEDPDWLDTIHDAAYAYLDLCDELDLRDVHLAGTSLGGWIAL
ncbi:MAG: alpha/beta fold hydrolase, partial [Gammaproteobacteria bacterium]|nr:alpha/beta fold hydrolase [Gammaproteobacteria bacterium]